MSHFPTNPRSRPASPSAAHPLIRSLTSPIIDGSRNADACLVLEWVTEVGFTHRVLSFTRWIRSSHLVLLSQESGC